MAANLPRARRPGRLRAAARPSTPKTG